MQSSPALSDILDQRSRFKAFLVSRLGSEADANDLLQDSLVKALSRANELHDSTKIVPWFQQLLRNAIVDHIRSRHAARRREEAWALDVASAEQDETATQCVCRCFESLISTLKPAQAALLRRVELDGQTVAAAAGALGLSPGNASVILHRARARLREKLLAFCGPCADEACLNCDCDESAGM